MDEQQEIADLVEAIRASDAQGPIVLQMDTATAVNLIAVIQLAFRHPGARHMHAVQQVRELARQGQDGLARRDERLGRYLERGWHECWDVLREE